MRLAKPLSRVAERPRELVAARCRVDQRVAHTQAGRRESLADRRDGDLALVPAADDEHDLAYCSCVDQATQLFEVVFAVVDQRDVVMTGGSDREGVDHRRRHHQLTGSARAGVEQAVPIVAQPDTRTHRSREAVADLDPQS